MNAQILCFLITAASSSGEVPLGKYSQKTACKNAVHVVAASKRYNLDPLVLASLIVVESSWRRTVVSSANACGLTQVLPQYSKYTCEELKNAKTSIYEGAYHLNRWSKMIKKPPNSVLSCYNAGWVCDKSKKAKRYAEKILRFASIYNKILNTN